MKIAIHQPEHWPYEGFFQKVELCDCLVILDDIKFKKNKYQLGNTFKARSGEELTVSLPVEEFSTTKLVRDVKVRPGREWRRKIVSSLFTETDTDFSDVYEQESLLAINMQTIMLGMAIIGLQRPVRLSSEFGVGGNNSERLAAIVKAVGGSEYISGPSGKGFISDVDFHGIKLTYFSPKVEHHYSVLQRLI